MQTVKARVTASEKEARRIFTHLEVSCEEDGFPVTLYEATPDGSSWAVEVIVFDMEPDDVATLIRERMGDKGQELDLDTEIVPEDINWVAKSLEGLDPVWAGRFVVHGAHDRDKVPDTAIGIEIEAALAFGTGHHATTSGCLLALDHLLRQRHYDRILDLGTGTGVLAIAAAKLTKQTILATDIDPVATRTAAENAKLNNVGPLIRTFTAPGVNHGLFGLEGPFDLVIANILAKPLMQMSTMLAARMTYSATLVLSGLRVEDGPRILFAYGQHGFHLFKRYQKDGWLTLTLVRARDLP